MKCKFIFFASLFILFSAANLYAQDTTYLSKEQMIEKIKKREKEALKKEVIAINKKLENEEITYEEAEELKTKAAEKHAIEIDKKIARLDDPVRADTVEYVVHTYPKRTTTDNLAFAFGINNAIEQGKSLNNSEFKTLGSRFAEISLLASTRLAEKSNFARLKYGLSVQFNALKPTDNRYFTTNNGIIALENYPIDLKKSKLNYYNLVVPVYLELGGYTLEKGKSEYKFSTHNKFKAGFGGYAGVSIGNRQKLKYEENGKITKEKIKASYPVNEFIYGISAYACFGETTLYVKYHLNPLFKEPNAPFNNISFGFRFEL